MNKGDEQMTKLGLATYLGVSLVVTWLCGGGPISLIVVCIFFALSIGKPVAQRKKTSDYVFDVPDDTDSD